MSERYNESRAVKKTRENDYEFNMSSSKAKRYGKKITKSVVLIVIAVTLVIGGALGFLASSKLNSFYMNDYLVANVASPEKDYVEVDVSKVREGLENGGATMVTMEQIYSATSLEDKGVTIKFLGMDVSKTLTTKYYYREDISHNTQEVNGVDVTVPGVYYIEYTSSHFAFKKTTLIRTIIVTGVEVDG